MYKKYIKCPLDIFLAFCAIIVLSPILLFLTITGAIAMKGNPFFVQPRPGKDEKLFKLIKFRTMTCETDENGNLLSDDRRLNAYGKFLRSTSLDELGELFNIVAGQLAIVGPRPQLVRDMVFMTPQQRKRHSVRQGLTGLAQVNGRNCICWEDKLDYDLQYIGNITFWGDAKIILQTLISVCKREGISTQGMATAEDLGDYLLNCGAIDEATYHKGQEATRILLLQK